MGCDKLYKWRHFKIESELSSQRNCLAHPTPQISEMFKLDKITFGLGQSYVVFQTTVQIEQASRHFDY